MPEEPDTRWIVETLDYLRSVLDWLAGHHSDFAQKADMDLGLDDRRTAVWKLSGNSVALSYGLLALLEAGFTNRLGRRFVESMSRIDC